MSRAHGTSKSIEKGVLTTRRSLGRDPYTKEKEKDRDQGKEKE